ncbi:MAG: hypothetical protein AB7E32_12145, partial [Desulfovibrio sp.]
CALPIYELSASSAARNSGIDYPRPLKAVSEIVGRVRDGIPLRREAKAIRKMYAEFIKKQWTAGLWTNGQQRDYHILASLQRIKRNVVKDRIVFAGESRKTFWKMSTIENREGHISKHDQQKILGKLFCIRAAVNERVNEAVKNLDNCQGQFRRSQEPVLTLDTPKPCMERRREQRLYSAHMSDKCRHIWSDLNRLWGWCRKGALPWDEPILQHLWEHGRSSKWSMLRDTTLKRRDHEKEDKGEQDEHISPFNDVYFINSSYFMPDRPDMLDLIGHEVAHTYVNLILDHLSPQKLSQDPSPFGKLVRNILPVLQNYECYLKTPAAPFARELLMDLLAASVQGPSYLYALAMDMLGNDLASMFRFGTDDFVDLDLRDYLRGAMNNTDIVPDWYLRLELLCCWIEELSYVYPEGSPAQILANYLVGGVRGVLESTLQYLKCITPFESFPAENWRSLAHKLKIKLRYSMALTKVVSFWRSSQQERYGDKWYSNKQCPLNGNCSSILPQLHDSARTLLMDFAVENNLAEVLSNQGKVKSIKSVGEKKELVLQAGGLFERLNDVPWQMGMLLALNNNNAKALCRESAPQKKIMYKLVEEITAARSRYVYALEIQLAINESPFICLENIQRIVNHEDKLGTYRSNASDLIKHNIERRKSQHERDGEHSRNSVKKAVDFLKGDGREWLADYPILQKYIDSALEKHQWNKGSQIIKAMLPAHPTANGNAENRQEIVPPMLIGRIILASINKVIDPKPEVQCSLANNKNRQLVSKFLEPHAGEAKADWSRGQTSPYDSVSLLGRYDNFIMTPMDRCPHKLPVFFKPKSARATASEERFLSFYSRWEIGIPIRLGEKSWDEVNKPEKLVAVLSICLTASSSRLVFVSQLLDKLRQTPDPDAAGNGWRELRLLQKSMIENDAQMLLMDGSEDLIILFYEGAPEEGATADTHIEERVQHIFNVQRVIYNDFLVARTELAFTLLALRALHGKKLSLRVAYRERDESSTLPGIKLDKDLNAVDTIEHKIGKKLEDETKNVNSVFFGWQSFVAHTPGRLDGVITLYPNSKKSSSNNKTCYENSILPLFSGCKVDRVQTDVCQLVDSGSEKI